MRLPDLASLVDLYLRFEWAEQAACRDRPDLDFFPVKGESVTEQITVCHACPVEDQCRTHARETPETVGIWGGESAKARRVAVAAERRVRIGRPPKINHGTYGGYKAHRRKGVPVCDECRQAERDYSRTQRERFAS